jgi:hypothetical protein
MTISCNEDRDSLLILPLLDEELIEKPMLFSANVVKGIFPGPDPKERKAFRDKIATELPAFISKLEQFKIPSKLRDRRYGVKAYASEKLLEQIRRIDPDQQLLSIVQETLRRGSKKYGDHSEIRADDLFREIYSNEHLRPGLNDVRCHSADSLGRKLTRLSTQVNSPVHCRTLDGTTLYQIDIPIEPASRPTQNSS